MSKSPSQKNENKPRSQKSAEASPQESKGTAANKGNTTESSTPKTRKESSQATGATKKAAMWGGRFSGGPAELVQHFLESQSYDRALYRQDIKGSKAHARMLAKQGILTKKEAKEICAGLDQIQKEIEDGSFVWRLELEDVHMNIESRLTEITGDVGKKLHTGRSRNDQVALDFRLYVAEATGNWQRLLAELIKTLVKTAKLHSKLLLPGFTHLQPAQPVSLAQHLLAYAFMFKRDFARLSDADRRTRISPLGAAALAGTTYPLDPLFTAQEAGMRKSFNNSMDAVSDRDFVVETTFCASLIMAHLSRLCEDIILWANPAFGFVRLSDSYSTGSSIMPQKKNPDVAELMRGKTGRVYGALMSLLTTIKGLPMTYNRDLQEDKEPFFQADRTVSMSLEAMSGMLSEMTFVHQRMDEAMRRGFLNATELADYLVGKGIPFREAHHYTGSLVAIAERQGATLEALPLSIMRTVCKEIEKDVYDVLKFSAAVARRETKGGTGPQSVAVQIKKLKNWLKGLK